MKIKFTNMKILKTIFTIITISFFLTSCNSSETTSTISGEITGNNIISMINNQEKINFVDQTITGNIDFSAITNTYTKNPTIAICEINSPITFANCHFTDSIIGFKVAENYAYTANFMKPVTFINCTFDKNINFRQAVFNDVVEFSGCTFNDEARFEGSVFYANNTYFHESTFEKLAKFTNSSFYGDVSFMNAVFNSDAGFNNCFFNRNANFGACNYKEMANFGNIEVRGFFRMNYSIYKQKAYFQDCIFDGKIEAVKINSNSNFVFSRNACNSYVDFNNSAFSGIANLSENYFIEGKTNFDYIQKSVDCEIITADNKSISTSDVKIEFQIIVE
jgi:Pentapeptide repeats (9 copies)